jgi:hypothetical protein
MMNEPDAPALIVKAVSLHSADLRLVEAGVSVLQLIARNAEHSV